MPRRSSSLLEILVLLPWWVGVSLAALIYYGLPWLVGFHFGEQGYLAAKLPATVLALLCLFAAVASVVRRFLTNRQLAKRTNLESLAKLHWKTFEDLMAEVFRRQGYSVEEQLGGGADGGVDLALRRNGQITLVQCKRWTGKSVGVSIVRELFGIMASERAEAGILVTTSNFTKECEFFCAKKSIRLIDGQKLLPLIRSVQKGTGPETQEPGKLRSDRTNKSTPMCARCGSPMALRTAKRGLNAGNQFWGCSSFPKCRYTSETG